MMSIIPATTSPKWSHAMKDQKWHHVAVTGMESNCPSFSTCQCIRIPTYRSTCFVYVDDGSSFSLWLDGKVIVTSKHSIPPKTAGGFVIGDWADLNRPYSGNIAGVQFFDSVLQVRPMSPPSVRSSSGPSIS